MRTTVTKRNHDFDSAAHATNLLARRSEDEQRDVIRRKSVSDALLYHADFEAWAHKSQLPPTGEGWRVWLMMAGRGLGKTRAGAEWIHRLATKRAGLRIALVGATINETRRIMIEGMSGLLTIARRQRRRVNWPVSLAEWQPGAIVLGRQRGWPQRPGA